MIKQEHADDVSLNVRTFDHFQISGGEGRLDANTIRSDMVMKLLAYMICHHDKAITIQELSEVLWQEDESDNPAGALKNLMYRLRTMLRNTWGDRPYIITGKGSYQWNPEMKITIDAEEFEKSCKEAANESSVKSKMKKSMEAVRLYQGAFLQELSSEYWVVTLSAYYHSLYLSTSKRAAECLAESGEYGKAEEICRKVLQIDSIDEEIHCQLIRALMAQNKRKLALDHYHDAVQLLYDSLGVRPSKELRDLYDELLMEQHDEETDISMVEMELQEKQAELGDTGSEGAFQCEYGVFQKIYTQQSRSSERLGISTHLALMTMLPAGNAGHDSDAYHTSVKKAMEEMQDVLLHSLRSADVICRYSENQFLIMLPACQYENALMVMKRLQDNYNKKEKVHAEIHYSIDEVVPS